MALSMSSLAVVGAILDLPVLAEYDTPKLAYEHRDTLRPMIQARIVTNTTDHWLERLLTRDVWCAKVQDFEDLMDDPQVAHNELIQTIHHPEAGDIRVIGVPVKFSETPGTIRLAPPRVGEHTGAILSELGYTPEEISVLRAEGVI
jgi:crotonobetainyl-CoA:carnitine CoA-transferase CaiB-like acyl-CoA transferase